MACGCLVAIASGCRLCCDLEDQAYSAYGGKWQRTDRNSGRVGSLFEPAGGVSAELSDREVAGEEYRSRLAPSGGVDEDDYPEEIEFPPGPDESDDDSLNEIQTRSEFDPTTESAILPGPPMPPASF